MHFKPTLATMNLPSTLVCVLAIASCCTYQASGQRFPGLPGLKDLINGIASRFDEPLSNLIGDVKNFARSLNEVAHCYEAELKDQQMNIFNESINFQTIISQYYVSLFKYLERLSQL